MCDSSASTSGDNRCIVIVRIQSYTRSLIMYTVPSAPTADVPITAKIIKIAVWLLVSSYCLWHSVILLDEKLRPDAFRLFWLIAVPLLTYYGLQSLNRLWYRSRKTTIVLVLVLLSVVFLGRPQWIGLSVLHPLDGGSPSLRTCRGLTTSIPYYSVEHKFYCFGIVGP